MIKLKSILESIYNTCKEFRTHYKFNGKIYKAILSPAIQNSTDNIKKHPFRITIFEFNPKNKNEKYIPIDHYYIDYDDDETILSTLDKYEVGDWDRLR